MRICRCCARSFQPLAHEHICDECVDMNFNSSPLAGINDRSTVAHCADSPSNILLENPARGYFNLCGGYCPNRIGSRLPLSHESGSWLYGSSGSEGKSENKRLISTVTAASVAVQTFKQAAGVGPGESHKLSVKRGATPRLCNHFNRLLLFSCLPIDFAPEPLLRLEIGGNSGATLLKGASL